jgi:transcription elongation GreA/GreB family factor
MTSQSLLARVKQVVLKQEYDMLQDMFIQALTDNTPLPEIWESIEYLSQPTINLVSHAQSLSRFVAEELLNRSDQKPQYTRQVLEHLRKTGHLLQPDRNFKQKILQVYKKNYPDIINWDTLAHLSGFDKLAPLSSINLSQVIDNLDKLVSLCLKNLVYSSRFGYGEVLQIDFLLESVLIDFFTNKTQTISIEQALKSLQIIQQDNFHYLKIKKPDLLKQMIQENPQALNEILKRDIGEQIPSAEVKKLFSPIIADNDIKSFLTLIKKSNTNRVKKISKDGFEIDYDAIPTLSIDQIIGLVIRASFNARQKILVLVKSKRHDWKELYSRIFQISTGKKSLQTVFSNLPQTDQQKIRDKIFTEYKSFPIQFLYLSGSASNPVLDSYSILTRYLDLAVQKHEKTSLAAEIRKRIIANNYNLLKSALSQIKSDTAERILEQVHTIKNFYPEELDQIKRILQEKFPDILKRASNYIYHTETAINSKSIELQRLISEEIPRVAAEIGHARGYGDLRENFEFKAAKEKQKRLLNAIAQMRHDLANARPIDFNTIDTTKVSIGTTVRIVSLPDTSVQLSYTILGPWDSDVSEGVISYLAPFAQNLLNKKIGDEITDTEGKNYKIIEIKIFNQ